MLYINRTASILRVPRNLGRVVLCDRRHVAFTTKRTSRSGLPASKPHSLCTDLVSLNCSHLRRLSSQNIPSKDVDRKSKLLKSARVLSFLVALSVFGGLQYFLVLRHYDRVPLTGRRRKMNITPEIEAQLGEDAYSSLVSRYKEEILPNDHPINLHVRRIVNTILEANDLGTVMSANGNSAHSSSSQSMNGRGSHKDRQWRLAIISSNHIANSTASTGGIIVFTGLLSLCKDEHELASILGHEIAHVVARHLAERYSKAKDWSLKRLIFAPSSTPQYQKQAQVDYEEMMATNMHFQELEADSIGLELTSRACFDPRAAIAVNQRLAALEDKLRRLHPKLKPTHPCSEERIKNLEQMLPRAYKIMSKSPRCAQMRKFNTAF